MSKPKRPSKRTMALARMKYAGYHSDSRAFTVLLIESRINYQTANQAFWDGANARLAGVKCNCSACNPKEPKS